PYRITPTILSYIASISEKIGEVRTAYLNIPQTELRRENRIKTIQASLEIEGNTLSIDQVSALLENKLVVAPQKDIQEVRNAIETYNQINEFDPYSINSLRRAHSLLLKGLVDNAGELRTTAVGIARGDEVAHIAPPAHLIEGQLKSLLDYVKQDEDLLLIKSCVFHYEFEFIHPFIDGNGRMGRLWQTVLLMQHYPLFEFLPIETLIKQHQQLYYSTLAKCDALGESTLFIEFMLGIIDKALAELLTNQPAHLTGMDRIKLYQSVVKEKKFARREYMQHFKDISASTASRDLREATDMGILIKTGDGRNTVYRYG
ncbi:MAG: Fic family protein, partial [Bacteroidales bacterium]|nr:Fic family protein [Bacteroidales bacterium]